MSEVKLSVCNIVQLFVLLHLFPNCPIYRNSECTTNIYWHLHITTVNHRHFAYIYILLLRIYTLYYPFKMAGVPVKLCYFPCVNS